MVLCFAYCYHFKKIASVNGQHGMFLFSRNFSHAYRESPSSQSNKKRANMDSWDKLDNEFGAKSGHYLLTGDGFNTMSCAADKHARVRIQEVKNTAENGQTSL